MHALSPRPHRSRLTLLAAGTLLSSALLAGCGFNYQTDRNVYYGSGTYDRDGSVDVLGAVIIAGEDNVGVFAATLVNNDLADPASLEGLEQTEQVAPSGTTSPIEITSGGRTSLFNEDAIPVEGDFKAGEFVDVTLRFDTGQVTTLDVPVMVPCRQYSPEQVPGLEVPTSGSSEASGETTDTESSAPESTESTESAEPSGSESATPSDNTTEELSETDGDLPDPYSCEAPPQVDPHADSGGEPEDTEEVQ